MGAAGAVVAAAPMAMGRPRSAALFETAGAQWHFICDQDGLSVAHAAAGVWSMENGVWLLPPLEPSRVLVADAGDVDPTRAPTTRTPAYPVGR